MSGFTAGRRAIQALVAGGLLAMAAVPCSAGSWDVTYNATGAYTAGGWDGGGQIWDAHPVAGSDGWVTMANGQPFPSAGVGGADGAVGATLTWVPDPDKDRASDPPPAKVSFVVSVSVGSDLAFPSEHPAGSLTGTASDGFGDSAITNSSGGAYCEASHSLCLPVPASGIVTLPPVRLAASARQADMTTPWAILTEARIRIDFAEMSVTAISTDGSGGPAARFVSGTNCEVEGEVKFPRGVGVVEARLYTGDQVAASFPLPDTVYVPGPYLRFKAHFDSTHFVDGSTLPLRLWVRDTRWLRRFWACLSGGDEVGVAVLKCGAVSGGCWDFPYWTIPLPVQSLWPIVQYDSRTKVHGLYKSPGLAWARPDPDVRFAP